LTTIAWAQAIGAFTVVGPVFEPADLTWGDGSTVGSPAIFRHNLPGGLNALGLPDVLFMAYETQVGPPTAGCPVGRWGVGLAASFDGVTWSDVGAILEPGTGYSTCVAAHPKVVALNNRSWLVYFKAEQDPATCPATAAWGCDRYPGLGRLVIDHIGSGINPANQYRYQVSAPDSSPVLRQVAQDMGYPTVQFSGSRYRLVFAQNPDLFATQSSFTTSFGAPTPIVMAGDAVGGWERDELYSPSFVCDRDNAYRIFVGGRIYEPFPVLADASVGTFTSADYTTWTEGTGPYLRTSLGDREVRHLDAISSDDRTQHGLFFSSPTGAGNSIFLAATPGLDAAIDSKRCP